MAGAYLNIIKGDDYVFQTNVAVDGVEQNLSGASLWFTARPSPLDDFSVDPVINVSSATNAISVSGTNSKVISVTLNANATANYATSNLLFWALRATLSNGNTYTLDRGRAAISISLNS